MSQENVEIVRRAKDALQDAAQRGELTRALSEMCDPDIHVDASRRVFNPDEYDGLSGMERLVREMWDAWAGFSHEDDRLIDLGDKVLSIQTIIGRGRASGVEVGSRSALVWTVRDGRVVHVEVYGDDHEALKAVGLDE